MMIDVVLEMLVMIIMAAVLLPVLFADRTLSLYFYYLLIIDCKATGDTTLVGLSSDQMGKVKQLQSKQELADWY